METTLKRTDGDTRGRITIKAPCINNNTLSLYIIYQPWLIKSDTSNKDRDAIIIIIIIIAYRYYIIARDQMENKNPPNFKTHRVTSLNLHVNGHFSRI